MDNMNFDYYYGDESNQFSFYRIPRQLITGSDFKRLSTDALIALLLPAGGKKQNASANGTTILRI